MSIKLTEISDRGITVEQVANLPTVYLDNWALDDIATNKQLLLKFKSILLKKEGTILISDVNLFEACKKNDISQFEAVLNMLDDLDFAFVDSDPSGVISNERNYIKMNNNFISPATPLDLVKSFVLDYNSLKPFKISNAFKALKNDDQTQNYLLNMFNASFNKYNSIIQRARVDPEKYNDSKQRFRNRKENLRQKFPFTSILWDQCIDYIVKNRDMKMPTNEWLDVFHTIVPVAYSEFVLLDNRWVDFVRQSGLVYPQIAKVYNKRNLDNFWFELEKYDPEERENEIKKSFNTDDSA